MTKTMTMTKMKKIVFTLCGLLLTAMHAGAQGGIVTGTVRDADDVLISVNVVEIDASNRIVEATTTDINGQFSLKVKDTRDRLQFSYIGYTTQTLAIGDRKVFNIVMKNELALDEVVIHAEKKESAGGLEIPQRELSIAAQSLDMAEFEGLGFTSVDEALQGRIAGLDIVMNSGNLGSGTTMRLRGVSSINGNSEPLIVVDGNVFETTGHDDFDYANADEEKFAELLCVNPDDIERISVLKDAAATAVWGSQGANGVIQIKTKRGSSGPARVTYSYRLNVTQQPEGIRMLNGDDYTMLLKEAYFNPEQSDRTSNIIELNYDPSFSEYENFNNNTDWVSELQQTGIKHSHSLSLTGGGEKATFRVSGGYDKETGSIIGQELDRLSTRVNLDYYVSDRIKISSDFSLTYTDNDRNYNNLLGTAYQKMPNMGVWAQDATGENTGRYYYALQSMSSELSDQRSLGNPVAIAHLAKNKYRSYTLNAQFELQYDLLSPDERGHQLRYNGRVLLASFNDFTDMYYPRELSTVNWYDSSVNSTTQSGSKNLSFTTRHTLTFTPHFTNDDHSFTTLLRGELNSGNGSGSGTTSYGMPNHIASATAQGQLENMWTSLDQWRSIYFTYSGHYSYKSRYALDITARLDGSTKFGAHNRWGFFPAISGRWNISDEPWMEWSAPWLSMLSLRPGWGQVGQQPGAQYLHFSRYGTTTQYLDMPAVRPNNIRLTDLRWETKTTWNIGTDIGLFDDLLTMDINFYDQLTSDLLMKNVSIPTSTGFSSLAWKNVGSMRNQGWELNISGNQIVKAGDFKAGFNITLGNNVNQMVEMDETTLMGLNSDFNFTNGSYLTRVQVANAFGSIYGFRFKGVYPYSDYIAGEQENAPVARDAEGRVIVDEEGEPLPMVFDYEDINYRFKGGDAIYDDVNHDGNINELDIVYLGNCNPKVTGGFGFRLYYKRWSANLQFNYRYGSKILNMAKMNAENMYSNNNQSYAVNWRWRTEGDETIIPRALHYAGYNFLGSDRFVENGSFCRLNFVQITYNFKPEWLKKLGVNSAYASLSANNLLNWTRYSGVDPEVGYGGYGLSTDNSQTPRARYFTASMSITF
jgi:TonB-linked SusC/RagA family outer membrane protein